MPELSEQFQDMSRAALEAFAAESYAREILSLEQVRELLALPSRWEAQDFLLKHGVWWGLDAREILTDLQTSIRVRESDQ